MRRYVIFPILALGGGCAAFALRLLQWRMGFEPDTGLPVPGTPFGILTAALAAAVMALCILLRKKLPEEKERGPLFSAGFGTSDAGLLTPAVAGVFLMAAAGLVDMAAGTGIQVLPGMQALSAGLRREQLILGALTLAAAASLFPAVSACRQSEQGPQPFNGMFLLAPVVCLVVRLVLLYRQDSANPVLAAYWVELLALVLVILALYRLAAFAYGAGRTRRFVLYAVPAILLCLASLADGRPLSALLFNGGAALTLTGFLMQRLLALSRPWDIHLS